MGLDYLTKQEIKRLESDEESVRLGLQANQITIANALKNGIGDEIISTLNGLKDTPLKRENKVKKWINKWRKKIF